ncbi:MAG: putative endonuclease [Flavobacteriaceae bacterium]|jgi:putative endonuclease
MRPKGGYIYIVSNKTRTVLYTGVTSNLYARIYEHKTGVGSTFTSKYKCTDLLYYQFFDVIVKAIEQEKRRKKRKRDYKENVIKELNPMWRDLFGDVEDMP